MKRIKDHVRSLGAQARQLRSLTSRAWHRIREFISFKEPGRTPLSGIHSGLADAYLASDDGLPLDAFCSDPLLKVKLIAFYLPQFHSIPENNEWWGDGFTEWTNVKPAKPLFRGHYQPHIPQELGYYDLLDQSTVDCQLSLARKYGISGFCFYFYWFNGTTLLEAPLKNYLRRPDQDLPFCLCWANENWSRRWDGLDKEILIAQQHSPDDDLAFIEHISEYLLDTRYIRVQNKPLLIVYRPSLLPDPTETAKRWRKYARDIGLGELFLAYTQSFEKTPPCQYGFDAAIEFPPNNSPAKDVTDTLTGLDANFSGRVLDFSLFEKRGTQLPSQELTTFLWRTVCPSWDNTPRLKETATIFINSSPDFFYKWIRRAIHDTIHQHPLPSERLVFINAWNEWAEGAHLEPDRRYGYAWLEACRRALNTVSKEFGFQRRLVLLIHDCHPHGAQYIALSLCKALRANGHELQILSLGPGRLLDDFNRIAPVHLYGELRAKDRDRLLKGLQIQGYNYLIANTTVSGDSLREFSLREFRILTLIHEMPELIRERGLQQAAANIAEYSDKVVFPAPLVANRFREICGVEPEKVIHRHQGLIRSNPYRTRRHEARQLVCKRHRIPMESLIILAIAFMDERKGPDLLVESLAQVRQATDAPLHCIWVGRHDPLMLKRVIDLLNNYQLNQSFHLAGFIRDPMEYYAAADVYALPSREDPFPNVVLESLHVGLPVVAFRSRTGCEELITQHGGELAPPLDCKAFASALLRTSNRSPVKEPLEDLSLSMHAYAMDLTHALMGTLRVSVIVPNYNYGTLIAARLASIASQTFAPYEIIVLDDASTDNSIEEIEAFRAECRFATRLVVNSVNSGSPFGQWGKGVELASGDLVWIAEADDLSHPDFLAEVVSPFSDPSVVLAYSDSQQIDAYGRVLAKDYHGWTRDLGPFWQGSYCIDGTAEIARAISIKNTIPNISSVLFRRNALKQALQECTDIMPTLRVAGDWYLYLNLLCNGKIAFVANSLNVHRRHSTSATRTTDLLQHFQEVERMQCLAAEQLEAMHWPEEDLRSIRGKASDYLEALRVQFALDD